VLLARVRLLAPFVPFLANELHEELTGEPAHEWPAVEESFVDPVVEQEEQLVEALTDDVRDIVEVIDEEAERIRVFVAADWKYDAFEQVVETGPDVGAVMGELMSDPAMRERGDAVNEVVADLVESVRGRDEETLSRLGAVDEAAVYATAESFLAREFDAEVSIEAEAEADHERAETARPFRPAVLIE
jgi:leucyl-tRNA synthetase